MKEEMYTHDNESTDFRLGYREGLEKALEIVNELIGDLRADHNPTAAAWVEIVKDDIEIEHSMYVVGDEE